MKTETISMMINGHAVGPHEIPEGLSMNDYLHEYAGLTGTKFGCGIGQCHACVIILDADDGGRETIHTCITEAADFDGQTVRTIEGHSKDGKLSALQNAFLDHYAFQCGFCTSGFLNEAQAFLEDLADDPIDKADLEREIAERLDTHICRCTGYVRYLEAVRAVVLADARLTR